MERKNIGIIQSNNNLETGKKNIVKMPTNRLNDFLKWLKSVLFEFTIKKPRFDC